MTQWMRFFQTVYDEWNSDKVTRLAASLSYYTVFSLAPLLVIIMTIAGIVLGVDVAQQQIVGQIGALVGPEGAKLLDSLLTNARRLHTGSLTTLIALGAIFLGATGVVGELKDSLNTIWNVTPKPGNGLFSTFFERVLSLGMILALGFLLLVSLIISAALTMLGNSLSSYIAQWVILAQALDFIVSFAGIALLFALLFKYLPDVSVAWRDVWVGALVTALLFTIGKYLIGLYLGNSNIATPFGAAGSLVVLFVWIYYTAQILFLGAETTQVYANTYGSGIKPRSDAMPLSDAAKIAQGTRTPTDPAKLHAPPPALSEISPEETFKYIQTEGDAFNPVRLVGAAVGVRIFGLLNNLLNRAK